MWDGVYDECMVLKQENEGISEVTQPISTYTRRKLVHCN
jgi:hypothetical protein